MHNNHIRIKTYFQKVLLTKVMINLGFYKRTICVAEILYYLWCAADFLFSILCLTDINKGGKILYGIHCGILTGMFYFMTILLSLRYTFYWNWLISMGFDRQMIYHKYCAYMAVVCCLFHIIDNNDTQFITWKNVSGWLTWISSVLMIIFATSYFRRKFYNSIFMCTHVLFLSLFVIFSLLHSAIFVPYGLAAIGIDVSLRTYDNAFKTAKITNISLLDDDEIILIEFTKDNFKYEAGQYIFLRIGEIGFFEWHPFSLSSNPSQGNIAYVHVKVVGQWTRRLQNLIIGKIKQNEDNNWYQQIKIHIEGPHGYLTLRKPLDEYKYVIFIGGGIGIVPLHSIFNQIIYDMKSFQKNTNIQHIDYVCLARSKELIIEFAKKNSIWDMLGSTTRSICDDSKFKITVNYNKCSGKINDQISDLQISIIFYQTSCQSYRYIKRPDIRSILHKAASECLPTDIAVVVSGPKRMITDCLKYADELGVDVHYEMFDW
eukprot:542805_1